jgi:hypothetical protein
MPTPKSAGANAIAATAYIPESVTPRSPPWLRHIIATNTIMTDAVPQISARIKYGKNGGNLLISEALSVSRLNLDCIRRQKLIIGLP